MNSERWQKVKGLFDAALAVAPAKREKFLKNACSGDAELRRELEDLLASFDSAEGFMDKPAAHEVASLIIERNAKLRSGERVAHYEIVTQIGEGGMGEVYLARDTLLNRKVALKILPANLTADRSRLLRFKQEAQAASALNHPNIITIYEIREYNGVHLIATEFVEGETLREKMSDKLNFDEALEIIIQVASALSVAHNAGVIHRDIKPENIMIRPDCIVKLLDFGLAKLTEENAGGVSGKQTLVLGNRDEKTVKTKPGMVLGTVNYMSPEQARGKRIDRRTDLWSLGVCLYETLSGKPPFSGKTVNHTLVAVMEEAPRPLSQLNREIPFELERVAAKLLAKKPEARYQAAEDLLRDLRGLKRVLETSAKKSEAAETSIKSSVETSDSVTSIAVLPFLTLGLTEDEEYLGLGLADALITQLSRTKKLAVRPTSAVRGFVNSDKNSTEIGRLLNVGSILEGSIQRIGKRLRVTVQLVDAESENSLWAKKFDIEFADIFAVEDEITTEIADALLLNLNSDEYRRIENRGTNQPEAYQAYLQGRYFWNKFIPEDLPKAIEAFEKAILFDPNFAGAYAGIARAYRYILGLQSIVESSKAKEKMLRAATNALASDDSLAEAHLAVAEIKVDEWDWKFAEREYQRAVALNPSSADARAGYAAFLSIFERFDEAFKQIERALELDPLSNRLRNGKGKILVIARRYCEAVELFEKAIQIEPKDALAHYFLGYAFACQEKSAKAISQYQTAISISSASPDAFLGYAYARTGERQSALEILEKLRNKRDVSQAELAVIYVGLGEKAAAFDALEKGFEAHDLQMQYLRVEHHYDALRGDSRFAELLRRVGLEDVSKTSGEQNKKTPDVRSIESKTLAVLPFATFGLSETEEYLSLGLADALITQLSQTRKLTVRPTNAVRNFTGSERDAAELGRKLNVGAVLEGNLQKSGERLRVTVQLIDVERDATLWADKFSVDFTDFFEVQDQIAEQVSRALLLKLNTSEQVQINKRFTESNAAYLEYLKGRHFWEKRDVEGFHKAIEHYKRAIDIDPTYALAYVGLSDVYCMLGIWGEYPQDEIFPRARAAAQRALEIDGNLAEANASLGRVESAYNWNWEASEKSYRKAVELNQNCINAHAWLAKLYVLKHRFDEAIEESKIAQKLDPLSPQAEVSVAAAHFYARRYKEAIERYEKAIKNHADFVPAIFGLGMSLAETGAFDEAIRLQEKAVELSKGHLYIEGFLAATQAFAGRREKALAAVEKFKAAQDKSLDYTIAAIYSRLNEKAEAFRWLEKCFAARDINLSGISIEPEFDNLRDEPRFNEMLARVGLPEAIRVPTSEIHIDKLADESAKKEAAYKARTTDDNQAAVSAETGTADQTRNVSSAEYIITEIKRHKRGALIFAAILTLILAGAAAVYFYRVSRQPTISSIAVLPFQNASGDENLEYLSDGLSESLTNKLAQIGELKVIAQTSTFRYKNKEIDPKEIGKTLGVEALLTGKITKFGDGLSVIVELFDSRDGAIIWSEKYNLDAPEAVADAQLVQNRIAVQTVKNLNLSLDENQNKQLTKYATQNANAYQLYLNAALVKRRDNTLDIHRKAIDFYNQAIALDPDFALAYASLANSYRVIHSYEARPNSDTRRKIEEKMYQAIERARQLDPDLPEVYTTLGGIKMNELDLAASEKAYRRALELSPNSPDAHSGYANYLTNAERFDEALTHVRIARQLDPLSLSLKIVEGRTLFLARRFDEAVRLLQNLAKTAPENPLIHFYLAESYLFQGMTAEAVSEHEKIRKIEGERPTPFYIFALAKAGKTETAREQLEKLEQSGNYAPAEFAVAYIALGDMQKAFAHLEKAFQERDPQLQYLKIDPHYDEIRSDPRFQDLLRRVGLVG